MYCWITFVFMSPLQIIADILVCPSLCECPAVRPELIVAIHMNYKFWLHFGGQKSRSRGQMWNSTTFLVDVISKHRVHGYCPNLYHREYTWSSWPDYILEFRGQRSDGYTEKGPLEIRSSAIHPILIWSEVAKSVFSRELCELYCVILRVLNVLVSP